METNPIAGALEACLEQLQAGASLEQALALFPQWVDELRPLLLTAQSAQTLGRDIRVPKAARARSRARFLQATRQPVQTRPKVMAWRLGLAILAFLLVLGTGAATTAAVSARSLPGETLYQVKIAAEHARLLLAGNSLKRLELQQSFDQERLNEVETLSQRFRGTGSSQPQEVTFAGSLTKMQPGEWMVAGVRVIIAADTRVSGEIQTGDYIDVQGVLQLDGTVLANQIQERQIDISGRLEAIGPNSWTVNGITVILEPDTLIEGSPAVGAWVKVKAFWTADGGLQAQMVEVTGENAPSQASTITPFGSTEDRQPGPATESTETVPPEATQQATEIREPTEKPSSTDMDGELKTPSPTEAVESHSTPQPTNVRATSEPPESTEQVVSTDQPQPTDTDHSSTSHAYLPTPDSEESH